MEVEVNIFLHNNCEELGTARLDSSEENRIEQSTNKDNKSSFG